MSSNVARNNELFPAVVAGDTEARRAMIEENMALVIVKVDSLIKELLCVKYLRADLISAGNLGLVWAVNRVAAGKVKKAEALNKYIGRGIMRSLFELLRREHTIYIPARTIRQHRSTGGELIPAPVILNTTPKYLKAISIHPSIDLHDLCYSCCQSDDERRCLQMREEKYTFVEIAKALDIPLTTLYDRFRHLRARIAVKLEAVE